MSHEFQILLNRNLQDLNPVFAGWSYCPSGQHIVPDHRHNTLIHYVVSGCGMLHLGSVSYRVCAGQAFIIFPGQMASYTADKDDPWHYRWIGFTGSLAESFFSLPPVFDVPENMFRNLKSINFQDDGLVYHLAADLFSFYGQFLRSSTQKPNYVQMVADYIQLNYAKPLTVQEIADHVGLNRNYLSRYFKYKTGRTIQAQILDVRLSEARRYLMLGYSVKETSDLCGYSAPSIFSKLFKREYNMSPSEFRLFKSKEADRDGSFT